MLARAARPTQALLKRGMRTDPITRLELDILASQAGQDVAGEPRAPVSKSPEAVSGETMRGDVQLPRELQDIVDKVIKATDVKQQIRQHAETLYAHLRSTSGLETRQGPKSNAQQRQTTATPPPTYDDVTSLAYLAGLMPSVFAATLHAMTMARNRLELVSTDGQPWMPERIIDFGSGTASAAWAVDLVWPDVQDKEYVGLDSSRSMVEISSALLGALPGRVISGSNGTLSKSTTSARAHQIALPASRQSMAKLQLSPTTLHDIGEQRRRKRTMAVAAFSLADVTSREKRKEFVRGLWETGADVILVIDRGTPGGSRRVIEAREQLLMFGRRSVANAIENEDAASTEDVGSYVLAPCPHDGKCPLHNSTKSFCHFSQRVRSPPFLRNTKHSSKGEDDAKFSYVVIKRGTRPPSGSDVASLPYERLDALSADLEESETISSPEGEQLAWPRLVAPPLKRSGHVILEVCTASGELQRHTIPKSQGRQPYYDARKSAWGDSFPHPPKNGPQPAPAASSQHNAFEAEPTDKFGPGRSKLKEKKLGRRKGKDDGAAGQVMEYQVDIGDDGQLKFR